MLERGKNWRKERDWRWIWDDFPYQCYNSPAIFAIVFVFQNLAIAMALFKFHTYLVNTCYAAFLCVTQPLEISFFFLECWGWGSACGWAFSWGPLIFYQRRRCRYSCSCCCSLFVHLIALKTWCVCSCFLYLTRKLNVMLLFFFGARIPHDL